MSTFSEAFYEGCSRPDCNIGFFIYLSGAQYSLLDDTDFKVAPMISPGNAKERRCDPVTKVMNISVATCYKKRDSWSVTMPKSIIRTLSGVLILPSRELLAQIGRK